MSFVGEMKLSDGRVVLLEVSGGEDGVIDRVGRASEAVQGAAETLQEALERVQPALDAMLEGVGGLARQPDSVAIDFGVKLNAEAGVVVAKATAEANFLVHLEWSNTQEL